MITWAEIQAEAGDYKAGFVALFRKYEGQTTDEKTAQDHPVKVTRASFARHFGIAEDTFRHWIKASEGVKQTVSETDRRRLNSNLVTRVARQEPEVITDVIMSLPKQAQDAIYDDVKQRRLGMDTSVG